MESIMEIQNLSFSYNNSIVFENLNFQIKNNSYTAIIGSTGCGKSTLINLLFDNYKYSGKIIVNGVILNQRNRKKIMNSISYIKGYMEPIFDNVYLELFNSYSILGYNGDEIDLEIKKILKKYGITNLLHKKFKEISTGEKQLVILLSKIILNKKIMILDDALISLDNQKKYLVLKELKKISKTNTIINITSNIEEIIDSTDVIILSSKEVVVSSYKDIIQDEKIFIKNNLKLPFYADLSIKLKYYNLISKTILKKEKMVEQLWN